MADLAVVIVNYKNELLTVEYIKNELSKIQRSHIVIIVNNSATTESNDFLCSKLDAILVTNDNEIDTGQVTYVIPELDNLGFAKGNNLGAEFAIKKKEIKFILFSNNDIRIISHNILDLLIDKMKEINDIGMIGPNCLGLDGEKQSPREYLPFHTKFITSYWLTPFISKKKKRELMSSDYPSSAKEGDHYKLSGSFFLVRTSDFIKCGMMDPATFLYCEEEILTERMYSINKRVYFCPEVTIIHEHSKTISKFINEKRKFLLDFKSNSYYYKTYKGVSPFIIFMGKINHILFFYVKKAFKKNK